jgi:hypothetical protein
MYSASRKNSSAHPELIRRYEKPKIEETKIKTKMPAQNYNHQFKYVPQTWMAAPAAEGIG